MKTFKLNDELHKKIKIYCAENEIKIGDWIEKILQIEITKVEKKNEKTNSMEKKLPTM